MKTILHLIDTMGPGGAEEIFLKLIEGLDAERWPPHAMVRGGSWVHDELSRRGMSSLLIPTRTPVRIRFLARLVSAIRRLGVDLVQTHFVGPALYGCLAGAVSRVPVVCTLHGHHDLESMNRAGALQYSILRSGASRIVLVSDALRDAFHDRGRFPPERTTAIHNGIDTSHFRPGSEKELRRSFGCDDDDVLVGAVGNIRPPKGYDSFLRAAARVVGRDSRFRFVVVGDRNHPLYSELLDLRQELELEDTVRFPGYRPDVERIMRCLDVYVCPSRSEGFSLTTVQAMATGVPVVVTRSGGPEEIVRHGIDGLLVPPDAPEETARAILRVGRDRDLARGLGHAGGERARDAFSIRHMLGGYESLYEKLLR